MPYINSKGPAPGSVAEAVFNHGLSVLFGREIQEGSRRVVIPDALIQSFIHDSSEDGDPTGRTSWRSRFYAVDTEDLGKPNPGCVWININTVHFALAPVCDADALRKELDATASLAEIRLKNGESISSVIESLKLRLNLLADVVEFGGDTQTDDSRSTEVPRG